MTGKDIELVFPNSNMFVSYAYRHQNFKTISNNFIEARIVFTVLHLRIEIHAIYACTILRILVPKA